MWGSVGERYEKVFLGVGVGGDMGKCWGGVGKCVGV